MLLPATAPGCTFRSDDIKSACECHLIEPGFLVASRRKGALRVGEVRLTFGAVSRINVKAHPDTFKGGCSTDIHCGSDSTSPSFSVLSASFDSKEDAYLTSVRGLILKGAPVLITLITLTFNIQPLDVALSPPPSTSIPFHSSDGQCVAPPAYFPVECSETQQRVVYISSGFRLLSAMNSQTPFPSFHSIQQLLRHLIAFKLFHTIIIFLLGKIMILFSTILKALWNHLVNYSSR